MSEELAHYSARSHGVQHPPPYELYTVTCRHCQHREGMRVYDDQDALLMHQAWIETHMQGEFCQALRRKKKEEEEDPLLCPSRAGWRTPCNYEFNGTREDPSCTRCGYTADEKREVFNSRGKR